MHEGLTKEEFLVYFRHACWVCGQIMAGQEYNLEPNESQAASILNHIQALNANPGMTPEENHDNWMKHKLAEGWTLGTVKDFEAKTHPDLIPYADLPEVEQRKDTQSSTAHRLGLALWARLNSQAPLPSE